MFTIEGDKLITNVIAETVRRDRLAIEGGVVFGRHQAREGAR